MTTAPSGPAVDAPPPEAAARLIEQLRLGAVPPTEDVERLHQLLAEARAHPSQAWADLLLGLASDARTVTWQDVHGRATFEVARKALLAMGYPYAFQLEPDALLGPEQPRLIGGRSLVVGGLALLWNLALLIIVLASQSDWSARSLLSAGAFALAVLQSGWSLALSAGRAVPWLRGLAWAGAAQLCLLAGVVLGGSAGPSALDWLGVLVLGAPTLALTVDLALRARAEVNAEAALAPSEDAEPDPRDGVEPVQAPIAPVTDDERGGDGAAPEPARDRPVER